MNLPADWKVGKQKLAPGVYMDAKNVDAKKTLHFDIAELLIAGGFEVTPLNEAVAIQAIEDFGKANRCKVSDADAPK